MQDTYHEDLTFDTIDFTQQAFAIGDYENCRFIQCNFSAIDVSDCKFADCEFIGCNLSMTKLNRTAFRDVVFKECKMLGLQFDRCSQFGLSFTVDQCNLNHCSFYETILKKSKWSNSQFHEADFTSCDLSGSVLDACDFLHAHFERTNLEKADLRSSFHYSIHPASNRIKKAKFSLSASAGLLEQYDIEIDRSL